MVASPEVAVLLSSSSSWESSGVVMTSTALGLLATAFVKALRVVNTPQAYSGIAGGALIHAVDVVDQFVNDDDYWFVAYQPPEGVGAGVS